MTATAEPLRWPLPRWIAHRGAGKLALENTLAAFRIGAAHGYRAFECDVKLSAEGVPFLLHDATLDRTTDGQGTAGAQDWSSLSQRDAGSWHSRLHAGEPVPTLAAIARFVRANGFALNIEIKPTPGDEAHTGEVVARAVRSLWPEPQPAVLLSSFRPEALAAAQRAEPGLLRALLLDSPWPDWWSVSEQLGCTAVVTNHRLMDAALRNRLRDAGRRALVYTVNDAAEAQRLMALGIDGIITDAVDRFAPVD